MRAPILLRAKSGARVGLGHVMRTLAVAEAVRELGGEARLVLDDEASAGELRACGFEAVSATAEPDWYRASAAGAWLDGFVDWTAELRALARRSTPAFLVENRTPAREWCARLVYPSLHHEPDAWDRVHGDRVLAGAAWIPLSRAVRASAPALERDVDLLITFGGSDPLRSTERALAALPARVAAVVAVGPHMAARRAAIEALAAPRGARVLPAGTALAPWMARARVALTALGTTLYELAHLGTPALILANHEGDRDALEVYRARGPHRPLGLSVELDDAALACALAEGVAALRTAARPRVPELGAGAERLARALLEGALARTAA